MLLIEVADTDGNLWRVSPDHVTAVKPAGSDHCLLYLPGLVIHVPESADALCASLGTIEGLVTEITAGDEVRK